MSSPLIHRPGTFGIQGITGGVRRKASPPAPPALNDLMHWFDFTDIDTLFQDTASLVPVVGDNNPIRSILNKGFDGTKLIEDGIASGQVLHVEDEINGLSTGEFGGTELLSAVIAAGGIDEQVTVASVHQLASQGGNDANYYGWATNRCSLRDDLSGGRDYEGLLGGIGFRPNPAGGYAAFVYHWFYAALDTPPGVDNAKSRDSTTPTEDSFGAIGFDPFVNPGSTLVIGDTSNSGLDVNTLRGNIAEVLIWNTYLNSIDRDSIPDYFEAKYGGVFPI